MRKITKQVRNFYSGRKEKSRRRKRIDPESPRGGKGVKKQGVLL